MTGPGGPEVLSFVSRPEPVAGPGQALIDVAAIGVNFMDICGALLLSGEKVRRSGFAGRQSDC